MIQLSDHLLIRFFSGELIMALHQTNTTPLASERLSALLTRCAHLPDKYHAGIEAYRLKWLAYELGREACPAKQTQVNDPFIADLSAIVYPSGWLRWRSSFYTVEGKRNCQTLDVPEADYTGAIAAHTRIRAPIGDEGADTGVGGNRPRVIRLGHIEGLAIALSLNRVKT